LLSEHWLSFFCEDPRAWLLFDDDPAARWVTLTRLLDFQLDEPRVEEAHAAVLADPGTRALIERLPDWEVNTPVSGHESPAYAPNLLHLLADRGVQQGDHGRIERLLDQMLAHQALTGQFMYFGTSRASDQPSWSWLLCDTHAIVEVLLRFGRGDDPRVREALARMAADLTSTPQGRAWPCIPNAITGFRGPGRKSDVCPQATLEALRAFGRLPEWRRREGLLDVARVLLRVWERRGIEQPYMFGHGARFKTVKWPPTWYGVANVGQKREPSAFATAHLLAILRRFDDLVNDIRSVEVHTLASSRGGRGIARPPQVR
jgi:hypothetical protein